MSTAGLSHRGVAVRTALIDAAAELLLERGARMTLDDVAARAKVGRRTIFRYFATKDELIAAAIGLAVRTHGEGLPARDDRSVDAWLTDIANRTHEHNLRIAPAYLELILRQSEIPSIDAFLERPGRRRRHQAMEALATEVWLARGGEGPAPQAIADLFALHLSVFASEALRFHLLADIDRMTQLTVDTLLTTIDARIGVS